jgi:hypothetical protein
LNYRTGLSGFETQKQSEFDRRMRIMSNANHCSTTVLKVALTLAAAAACSIPMRGQEAPAITVGNAQITGLPDDWTHHHVVFADPGTEGDALHEGNYERWFKVVNEPRYVVQQLKRQSSAQGPSSGDVAAMLHEIASSPHLPEANDRRNRNITRGIWGQSLSAPASPSQTPP